MIAIAGGSGAGKSALAHQLCVHLDKGARIFELDNYYNSLSHLPPDARAVYNFDAPEALEYDLLAYHLRMIAAGSPADVPQYDFTTHTRRNATLRFVPADYVIVDGLHGLNWEKLRALFTLKVFIEAPHEVCLMRRIERDMRERGRSEVSVRQQYEQTVRPMYDRYVAPTRNHADLVLDGTRPLEELVMMVKRKLTSGTEVKKK